MISVMLLRSQFLKALNLLSNSNPHTERRAQEIFQTVSLLIRRCLSGLLVISSALFQSIRVMFAKLYKISILKMA